MKTWRIYGMAFILGIGLCGAQYPAEGAGAAEFLLPGEISIDHALSDVTGDGVEDHVYLIGRYETKGRLVSGMNMIVVDGNSGEVSRSGFNSVSGERGKLFIGDFNGDSVNDAMFALQRENGEIGCYAASFHGDAPKVIYESAQAAQSGEVVLTEADQGKTITVKKGSTVQLRLPENPSTGYTWQFDAFDAESFTFIGQQNFTPVGQNVMVGKPGLKVITVGTAKAGTAKLNLSHYRVWEGAASATQHFAVAIQIVE